MIEALDLTEYWESEYVDEHRRGISDMTWASMQPKGEPNYSLGDVVEFKVGGFGVVVEVNDPHDGWPSSYSCERIKGKPFHADSKVAWHYEGDFVDDAQG